MTNSLYLTISSFEDYKKTKWANGQISVKEVKNFISDCLREKCWGKLSGKDLIIHFGYDYYMYVGVDPCLINIHKVSQENNLFCEEFESPYL